MKDTGRKEIPSTAQSSKLGLVGTYNKMKIKYEKRVSRGFTGRAQNEDELRLELNPLLSNSSRILRHP